MPTPPPHPGQHAELQATILAAIAFFTLSCPYAMLKPLRETMGLDGGVDDLHWLFLTTLATMVPATLAFSWLVSRYSPRTCITATFLFINASLTLFFAALTLAPDALGLATGRVFYVWLSVINVLIISVFWAFIVDHHTQDQGRRLFAWIGAGGTVGFILGPLITSFTIGALGDAGLMAAANVVFLLALITIRFILAPFYDRHGFTGDRDRPRHAPLGGDALEGLRHILSNPRLRMLALYIMGFTILASLLYFERGRIIDARIPDREERTRVFSWMNSGGQAAALILQLLLTRVVLTRVGLGPALLALPLTMLAGFIALLSAATISTLIAIDIARSAAAYAFSKPAREVIFTTVPHSDRYKAKAALDTYVYRSGDAGGALIDKAVTSGTESAASNAPVGILAGTIVVIITLGLTRVAPRRGHSDP